MSADPAAGRGAVVVVVVDAVVVPPEQAPRSTTARVIERVERSYQSSVSTPIEIVSPV
jgi:hypothetical protein